MHKRRLRLNSYVLNCNRRKEHVVYVDGGHAIAAVSI